MQGSGDNLKMYFSDYFDVDPTVIEEYGAFDISLINDLPLFVDPFLLFNSDNPQYVALHDQIIAYVAFLRDRSSEPGINVHFAAGNECSTSAGTGVHFEWNTRLAAHRLSQCLIAYSLRPYLP